MQDIYPLDGLFNWTMTYRRDSDVIQPYGWVQPIGPFKLRPQLEEINGEMAQAATRKSAIKKTKLIAWFVSNCQTRSQREQYVNVLAKHVQVDVYGDCGSLSCDRDNASNCYNVLEQDYKFYLSFENSFCDDYVTEKFFSILQLEVVPIVFGGSDYSAMAPPFSYINAQDFDTAHQLADYLKKLDSDNGTNTINYYGNFFIRQIYILVSVMPFRSLLSVFLVETTLPNTKSYPRFKIVNVWPV